MTNEANVVKRAEPSKVIVTEFQIKFGSMVVFMIKLAIASIPATIILVIIFAILVGMFKGCMG